MAAQITTNATNTTSIDILPALKGYTVGTLPSGTAGNLAYVTDALAPVALAIVAAGGAATVVVMFNGSSWIVV